VNLGKNADMFEIHAQEYKYDNKYRNDYPPPAVQIQRSAR